MASYDDKEITEFIESLNVQKDSPESNVLNQLLLLEDSLFRRTIYAMMEEKITFESFASIPEINDATIGILLVASEDDETHVHKQRIFDNLNNHGLVDFRRNLVDDFTLFASSIYSTIENFVVPVSVSIDGSDNAKYSSYTDLQTDYLNTVLTSSHVTERIDAVENQHLPHLSTFVDFSQVHILMKRIQTQLSFVSTTYSDSKYLLPSHPIGFTERELFTSSRTSLSIFDKVLDELIDTAVAANDGNMQALGIPGLVVMLSKYDWTQLNTPVGQDYTELFNRIVIMRCVLPKFFSTFEDVSMHVNMEHEMEVYNAVQSYFTAMKDLNNVIKTEMNRYLV